MKILAISGSLRTQSSNALLLQAAVRLAPEGMSVTLYQSLSELPHFNPDLDGGRLPATVRELRALLAAVDGVLISSPEYAHGIPGSLKNALDWASREPDNRLLSGKPAAIVGAGGGMGTSRAQYHLRQVGVFLDLRFVNKPEVFSNAFSDSFDANGQLQDDRIKQLIAQQLDALLALAATLR